MTENSNSAVEFRRRKRTFAVRGLLPVLLFILAGCVMMSWALPRDNSAYMLLANALIFVGGMWYVISAKRYYRCPVCEKVVVNTKEDGTPSEISFGIDYSPCVCPYCAAVLK